MIWHRLVAVLAGLSAAKAIPNTHNPASFSSAVKVCFGNRSNLPHHFDVNTIACLSERGITPEMARTFPKRRKSKSIRRLLGLASASRRSFCKSLELAVIPS